MAKNKKITEHEIKAAVEKLITSAKKPTMANIKKIIAKKGNDRAIKDYLSNYKRKREHRIENEFIKTTKISKDQLKHMTRLELQQEMLHRTRDLEKSLSLVRATLESTADGILMLERGGSLVDWNQKFVDMFQIPEEVTKAKNPQLGFQYMLDVVQDPKSLAKQITYLNEHPQVKGDMGVVPFKDGRIIEQYSQPQIVGNRIVGRVWSFRDITARRKAEEALRLRERAIEASTHGVIITEATPDYKIIYVNPAFERITGFKEEEVIGRECFFLKTVGKKEQAAIEKLNLAFKERREDQAIFKLNRKDGKVFWNEMHIAPVPDSSGKVKNFVGIMVDVTEQKKMEEQLLHQATHDSLTDLPNRALLIDRLQQALMNAKRANTHLGILFLNLDRFKLVNDSLGHEIADKLLNEVAKRLKNCIREVDTLARVGGDEFVIILQFIQDSEDAIPVTRRILQAIAQPIKIDGSELNITASIGISVYPSDAKDIITLLKNADMAMYQAKDLGRNNFQFYTEEMNARVQHHLELEYGLRAALDKHEFEAFYQPCIDLKTGKIVGVEALLRWNHPKLGIVLPGEFIRVAEENGLIIPMGEMVLRQACLQQKKWAEIGKDIKVAINISGKQLQQANFITMVEKIIKETQANPKNLEFEVTETIFLNHPESIALLLKKLRDMGISIAIDDFGTGYSNLGYLNKLPINKLKIDISFIKGLPSDQNAKAITLAIIALSKNMNLKVLAEGVEKLEQVGFLREHDCDEAQGFYFAKPMNKDSLTQLLQEHKTY